MSGQPANTDLPLHRLSLADARARMAAGTLKPSAYGKSTKDDAPTAPLLPRMWLLAIWSPQLS